MPVLQPGIALLSRRVAVVAAPSASSCDPPASSTPVAWIDRAALAHNLAEVRRLVGPSVDVLAMVKSNAYGHGALLCAEALAAAGCRAFGVATVDEAVEIAASVRALAARAGDRAARVAVFGGLLPDEAGAAVAAGAEVATQELSVVRALGERASAAGTEAVVHVKIDTGMHRLGVAPGDAVEFVRAASAVPGVRVAAICSHFAQAESVTTEVTAGQLERMLATDRALRAAGFELPRHLANSAGILTRPETHLDMVRPGIMLYGVAPDPSLAGRAALRPAMRLTARVIRVADVEEGEGIGYGHTFRAARRLRVATVRCGYADGYPRVLGNVASALLRGSRVPLVGRICMDHAMFDVTEAPGAEIGDEVTLWGDAPRVDEVAAQAGSIAYEMLARVAARVARRPVLE
jgi:alanine racemase